MQHKKYYLRSPLAPESDGHQFATRSNGSDKFVAESVFFWTGMWAKYTYLGSVSETCAEYLNSRITGTTTVMPSDLNKNQPVANCGSAVRARDGLTVIAYDLNLNSITRET